MHIGATWSIARAYFQYKVAHHCAAAMKVKYRCRDDRAMERPIPGAGIGLRSIDGGQALTGVVSDTAAAIQHIPRKYGHGRRRRCYVGGSTVVECEGTEWLISQRSLFYIRLYRRRAQTDRSYLPGDAKVHFV